MRVAVDTNVLIAGLISPRWPYEVLQHALKGDFTLVLSPLVIREARMHIESRFPEANQKFERFVQVVGYEEAPLPTKEEVEQHSQLVRDKKDVPIALSIKDASVDYFVTYDKVFTDEDESTREVRVAIPGILLPPVFLREVMGWTSEELEKIRGRMWSEVEEG